MFDKNTRIVFLGGFLLLLLTMIFVPKLSSFIFFIWALASFATFLISKRRNKTYVDEENDSDFSFDSLKEKLSFNKNNNRHASITGSTKEEQELFERLSKEFQDITDKEYDPPIKLEWDTFNPLKWSNKSKRK